MNPKFVKLGVDGVIMTSVESWAKQAKELKANGLTDREIGEELHLSPETISWLITRIRAK